MSTFQKLLTRIRVTLKWSMVLLTVALLVLWLGSGWFVLRYGKGNWTYQAYYGCFLFGETTTPESGWHFGHPKHARYVMRLHYANFRIIPSSPPGLHSPIWIAAVLPATASALLWRNDCVNAWKRYRLARRERWLRSCRKCGFSLEGLAADAVCPECGNARGA